MPFDTHRPLPPDIRRAQDELFEVAVGYGLDFFPTVFEMVDYEEMSMLAAYGGFPTRYPHWRFGAEYDEMRKSYSYGLSKIYEMVINTDPCYAYLLDANELADQKLVIAHVYGHADFFKHNAWFAKTNRKMLDQMANHAARINRYVDRFGYEAVEQFVDACLSLDDLIDPHSPFAAPRERLAASGGSHDPAAEPDAIVARRFDAKGYMEGFINPPEVLAREEVRRTDERQKKEDSRSFPESPQRDVLAFLLEHAPLKDWQHDVLSIVRDEAYYYAPQGQTKIINEGWASFWHSTIMTRHGLTDADVINYADHHSGTMATSPQRLNPYKLGIELLRDVEERWDAGKFGPDWDACDDLAEKERWDRKTGLGRQKIFEVRRVHNDVTFIDEFLTPEFCAKHKLFTFAYDDAHDLYEIASREFQKVKRQLLASLTNHGRPVIRVIDGNHRNRGELYLRHDDVGIELRDDYAKAALENLCRLWGRPVHVETLVDDEPAVLSFDGKEHVIRPR